MAHNATQILCIIHDNQANAYNTPFASKNGNTAIRSFHDSIQQPGSVLHNHPEDFVLYQTGTFDELTGDIEITEPRIKLANGVELAASLHAVGE